MVTGGARLAGEVPVRGAKNSVLKLMAATLLAEGTTPLTDVPAILDVPIMSELLRAAGLRVAQRRPGAGRRSTVPGGARPRGRLRPGAPDARDRSRCWARCSPAAARRRSPCPAVTPSARAPAGHAHRRAAPSSAPTGRDRARLPRRPRPAPGGTRGVAGLPERRRHGEPAHGRGARRRARRSSTTPPASPRSSTCADADADGRPIDGVASSTLEVEGVDGLSPVAHDTVPDRIVAGTWAVGGGDDPGRRLRPGRTGRAPRDRAGQAAPRPAPPSMLQPDGFRVRMDRRPTAVDVVTLPYPGFPTDLQPMVLALNERRRRHGHGDRERLRGALDVRRRAAPAGRATCAPTATTPSSAAVPGSPEPPCGRTTSAPGRVSCWPAWWPTA